MIKAIIFDLDGTLLNTLNGLKDSTNYALAQFAYKEKTQEEIRSYVGNGVKKLIERAIPNGKNNPQFENCLNIFKEHYSRTMNKTTEPYPNIVKLLRELKNKDIKIAVVSNKFDSAVKNLCNDYFPDLIDVSIGESKSCKPKPETDGIEKALYELKITPKQALYIGDSEVDVQTAINANLKFIGVAWGFRTPEQIKIAGGKIIINEPMELLNFLN